MTQPTALETFYPEVGAGGFSRADGTVALYQRIHSLMTPESVVLDFGAGRGFGPIEDPVPFRRQLRTLKGRCKAVIGVDVDPAVLGNSSLDRAFVVKPLERLPIEDSSVDVVVSDATFEHIEDPGFVCAELDRVLKPGGYICARTPNRWGYIGIGANIVPNRWHVSWLKVLQPHRKAVDVFPTSYRLNTPSQMRHHFPLAHYEHFTYGHFGEPAYFGTSKLAWGAALLLQRITPQRLAPMWLVFLRKREQT